MKPTGTQLSAVKADIEAKLKEKPRSWAEIGRLADVHPSQVSRICGGDFQTFSPSLMQICKVLGVKMPVPAAEPVGTSLEWVAVQSSMRRIWDETPEGARTITKLLSAIAELQSKRIPPGNS